MVLGVIFVWMMGVCITALIPFRPGTASGRRWLLPDDVYGRPVTGLPVVESGGVDGWAMRLLPAISVLALVGVAWCQ